MAAAVLLLAAFLAVVDRIAVETCAKGVLLFDFFKGEFNWINMFNPYVFPSAEDVMNYD